MAQQSDVFTRLGFYWYETNEGEEAATSRGQLVGSMNRLVTVREELDATCDELDIVRALERLAYHVENYLVRVYELRERLVCFLVAHTGKENTEAIKRLKNPNTRKDSLASLPIEDSLSSQVGQILRFLDEDILLRDTHTHRSFLNLGLFTGNGLYDPADALLDLEMNSEAHSHLVVRLFDEVSRVAAEYQEKIQTLNCLISPLLQEIGQ